MCGRESASSMLPKPGLCCFLLLQRQTDEHARYDSVYSFSVWSPKRKKKKKKSVISQVVSENSTFVGVVPNVFGPLWSGIYFPTSRVRSSDLRITTIHSPLRECSERYSPPLFQLSYGWFEAAPLVRILPL